jgi:hypothetical protein
MSIIMTIHDVEDDSDAPVVNFLAVTFAPQDLRSDIPRSPAGCSGELSLDESR